MEDQKKNNITPAGQRISVRPGNFAPPPAKNGGNPQQSAADRPQNGNKDGQNRHGSGRGRNRHRRTGERPEQAQRPAEQTASNPQKPGNGAQKPQGKQRPQGEKPGNGAQKPQNNIQKPQSEQGRDKRHQKNRGNRQKPQEREAQKPALAQEPQKKGQRPIKPQRAAAPKPHRGTLSESLQKELDEEFSAFSLSTSLGTSKQKRAVEQVVDTKEFEVDIATAAYLVEDIPCGFPAPDGKSVEVVGVRFRQAGKVYFFAPNGIKFAIGDNAIVDTARGPEFGDVVMLNRRIAEKDIIQPLRPVLRRATKEDIERNRFNHQQEAQALKICAEKIAAHKLEMHLVDAQYAFDNSKLLFYYTAETRVDFRELVRDLAGVFHTRIELRQIGIRDEARLIGGLGMCGRPFCCATFLSDFGQVSVKMAKEQGLSINTSKISGCCGRLMCCLRYEHETYQAEARLTPKKDTLVRTPEGDGTVVDASILTGLLKVRMAADETESVRVFHRDDVTVLPKNAPTAPHEEPKTTESDEQQAQ